MERFLEQIAAALIGSLVILLILCSTVGKHKSYTRYKLQDGRVVSCRYGSFPSSGPAELTECEDGSEYLAQTNVEKLP